MHNEALLRCLKQRGKFNLKPIKHLFMRAIDLSKLRPSVYRSVTEMVFTSSQNFIKPSAMDRRRTQICVNKNWIGAISTIPPENINQIVLLEYFESGDDVHIKYFYRRQPPACLRSWTQFNLSRRSMPGTNNDSVINVHLCRNGVPGMSAAYENHSLVRLIIELRVSAALFCFEFFPVRWIMPNFALGN